MTRIEQIEQMLRTKPTDAFLNHALGLEWYRHGDKVRARLQFEKVISLHPDYVGTYFQLGKLLEELSIPKKAKDVYTKGISVAHEANDFHSKSELQSALMNMDIN